MTQSERNLAKKKFKNRKSAERWRRRKKVCRIWAKVHVS